MECEKEKVVEGPDTRRAVIADTNDLIYPLGYLRCVGLYWIGLSVHWEHKTDKARWIVRWDEYGHELLWNFPKGCSEQTRGERGAFLSERENECYYHTSPARLVIKRTPKKRDPTNIAESAPGGGGVVIRACD